MGSDWGKRRDDPAADWNKPRTTAPAKKDRRRWCRGKVGVEHELAVVLDSWLGRGCCWFKVGKWERYETYKSWVIVGRSWHCYHIEQCVNCGKKLRHLTARECPQRVGRASA